VTVCAFPLFAQNAGTGSDILSALLMEVRALRVAVERAASATPQVQLFTARLAVQNERLTRATREADAVHQELDQAQRSAIASAAEGAELEEALRQEADPAKQQVLKQKQHMVKEQLDASIAAEARLRARDAEFANALALEQAQWAELNRRFEELERQLAARSPQ
jgi:hypothetical protein